MRDPWEIDPVTGIDPMTLLPPARTAPRRVIDPAETNETNETDGTNGTADQPETAPAEPWDWQTSPLADLPITVADPGLPPRAALPPAAIAPPAGPAAAPGVVPAPGRYRQFTLDDLADLRVPDLAYVIDGLIPTGSLVLFAGREKEGKSLALLDAAVAVAAGEDWAGRTTTAGPVIYCPAEDSLRTVRDRLRRRLGGTLSGAGRPLTVVPLSGVAVEPGGVASRLDLNDPGMMAELRGIVQATRPVLVVLDCLRELHGARENESDDMTGTMRPLRQLAHELNVAVVVVHHASKGASGSSRGSTAIAAACDAVASWTGEVSGEQPGEGTTGWAGDGAAAPPPAPGEPLRATLAIRGRDVPRTAIRLELGEDLRFRPVALAAGTATGAAGGAAALVPARDRILAALADGAWRTATEIAEAAGLPERTVSNNLALLMTQAIPAVERSGAGTRYDPFRFRCVKEAPPHPPGPAESADVPLPSPLPITLMDAPRPEPDFDRAAYWRS